MNKKKMNEGRKKKVCIVVLGDVGRSPRMQYHAVSFLRENYSVELVGYRGAEPVKELRDSDNLNLNYIHPCPEFKKFLPSGLAHIVKVLWQIITLFMTLLLLSLPSNYPDFMLVQNPPSVPALGVCYLFCKIFRSKFIVDWHNYGYTILTLSLGDKHLLVKMSKWFEFFFGRKSHGNLCVTKAMKEDLLVNHGIKATVFYDRPPDFFGETSVEDKHALFSKLGIEHGDVFLEDCSEGETIFTRSSPNFETVLREDRPALLISSTSWTEDEDFSILISALDEYDNAKNNSEETLPPLVCVITGKGPLREFYRRIIRRKNWKFVKVVTPWLEAADYPKIIGSADLGVSLHLSSSGLDLPMKVVDMFGCSVPVCAIAFNCLPELVQHGENGFVFADSCELFEQMKNVFRGFPKNPSPLVGRFKESLEKFRALKWHDNWCFNVKPIFS